MKIGHKIIPKQTVVKSSILALYLILWNECDFFCLFVLILFLSFLCKMNANLRKVKFLFDLTKGWAKYNDEITFDSS